MAYELVEEVLDHAPAGLDATEMLVLIVIAEQARRSNREADIHRDVFLRRCRIKSESGLRKVFRRLKEVHKLDVRVPLYTKHDGRVMYAVPGRTPTYVLPRFPVPKQCSCHRCKKEVPQDLLPSEEVPEGASTSRTGLTTSRAGLTTSPQDPPSVPSPPLGGVRTGGEGDEFECGPDAPTVKSHLPSSIKDELAEARAKLKAASHKHSVNGRRRENAANELFAAALKTGDEP